MSGIHNFQDKTSADKTSIGFDYQYYYFVNILLNLSMGQKIGYEVKDDIHIDIDNNNTILIQTKHTLKTNKQGTAINLTERDSDFWKTLYNWINVINDKAEQRTSLIKQLDFIGKTKFILVSNKNSKSQNKCLENISKVNAGVLEVKDFKKYLGSLICNSNVKDPKNKINEYINMLKVQDDNWLKKFLSKVEFSLNQDELIQQIRNTIRTKLFESNEERITDAFNCIMGNLDVWKYSKVKDKEKLYISYEEVEKKLHKCFLNVRRYKLPKRRFDIDLPVNFEEQTFIKQLIDIEDLDSKDIIQMAEYTTSKINFLKHIEIWKQAGYITDDELQDFNHECISIWKNIYNSTHRSSKRLKKNVDPSIKQETMLNNAWNCLDIVRQKFLKLDEEELNIQMSNGQFYHLSDIPQIGWHFDWEDRYK